MPSINCKLSRSHLFSTPVILLIIFVSAIVHFEHVIPVLDIYNCEATLHQEPSTLVTLDCDI